ncbi:hypothetical protein ACFPVT_10660 [Corynebacterium choanae]|uniref:hypothetical protein n=1 Tax=Corynebacterium choanae TaxID=1862358 RepID=UPI000F4EED30|nr:hypothetical protein [Corynebacterium choanae]
MVLTADFLPYTQHYIFASATGTAANTPAKLPGHSTHVGLTLGSSPKKKAETPPARFSGGGVVL